jgi:enoyl-CoA hydratase/carnithine racemase
MSASLLINREDRLLRITLNRAEKRNALNEEMCSEIVNAVEGAQADRGVGAILIDAAGPIFCAGMDLDEATTADAVARTSIHLKLFTMGSTSVKPIVAAVQGAALGGGVGLMANAHVVIAAQGTSFGLTEIRLGMWPFVIFQAMKTAIGERRTVELGLTGRIFAVPEALQWGLVTEAAPAFELDDRATAIATGLSQSPAVAIERGLRFVADTRDAGASETFRVAEQRRAEIFGSPDFTEGARAFREKRKPEWPSIS